MRLALKGVGMAAAVAVLVLAGYGGWSLWEDSDGSHNITAPSQQPEIGQEAPRQSMMGASAQGAAHDEHRVMMKRGMEHMEAMQPIMEEMMRDGMGGGMMGHMMRR